MKHVSFVIKVLCVTLTVVNRVPVATSNCQNSAPTSIDARGDAQSHDVQFINSVQCLEQNLRLADIKEDDKNTADPEEQPKQETQNAATTWPSEQRASYANVYPYPYGAQQSWTPYRYPVSNIGFDLRNNEGVYYPHLYQFASPNPYSGLGSLPPVYSTHILNSLPPEEDILASNYDAGSNDIKQTHNIRLGRRTEDEEFMTQLAQDATLNNMLPTMPILFDRQGARSYQAPYYPNATPVPSNEVIIALYPQGVSDCAQPFLFSCNPEIASGLLSPYSPYTAYPAVIPQLVLPPPPIAYRGYRYAQEPVQLNNNLGRTTANVMMERPKTEISESIGPLIK